MPQKIANQPLSGQSVQPVLHGDAPLAGGLNAKHSPRWLQDTQATFLRSVDLTNVTRPARRHGYVELPFTDTGIDAGLQSKRIAGLFDMNPSSGTRSLVITIPDSGSGATFYVVNPYAGPWAKAYESDGTTTWDPGTETATAFMANERLWMIGGQSTAVRVLDNTHTLTPGGTATTDAPFNVVDGTYFLNRVYLLSGIRVYWSSLLPTTPVGTFDQSTNYLELSPNKGSKGVALRPWRDTSLIIFFNDSIEELIINSSDPSSSVRNIIEPNYGCGSRDSVVVVGEDMYFIDQYGHLRSLRRTSQGIIQGVVAQPFSDIIRDILPGRLNKQRISRVRCHLNEDKLDVYFPIDLTTENSARVRWDFSQQLWTGPDVFSDRLGHVISSSIRDRASETFVCDADTASPDAAVYRFDPERWSDAGAAIRFKMDTKGLTMGFPEAIKDWLFFELEYHGDIGVAPTVRYRLDEVGSFTDMTVDNGDSSLAAADGNGFPITSFPVTFPVTHTTPGVARARYILEADAVAKARCIEFEIDENTADTQFKVFAWRLTAQPKFISKEGFYGD